MLSLAWIPLSGEEDKEIWNRFDDEFSFTPSMHLFPGIRERPPFITYDLNWILSSSDRKALFEELHTQVLALLLRVTPPDRYLYVLDWQHTSYRWFPHLQADPWSDAEELEDSGPTYSDGDYSILLEPDLKFAIFMHPWERSLYFHGNFITDEIIRLKIKGLSKVMRGQLEKVPER